MRLLIVQLYAIFVNALLIFGLRPLSWIKALYYLTFFKKMANFMIIMTIILIAIHDWASVH